MADPKPTVNLPLAVLCAAALVAIGAVAYFALPGAKASLGDHCRDAAEWHLERATVDDAESSYHYRAGQSFLLLDQIGSDCQDWKLTKENLTHEP